MKIKCNKCGIEKEANSSNFYWRNDSNKWKASCKECCNKGYDPEKAKTTNREYYFKNRDKILKDKKEYRKHNLTKLNAYNARYKRTRYASDECYRLRMIFSGRIRRDLKYKHGVSYLSKLNYSINDLKTHLESQFELWMDWSNFGSYDSRTWKDDDADTWTWNIDHIIPHSELPYDSMDDPNFHKCWALDNLRPLSSKQNCLDGCNRKRHKNEN